MSPLLRRPTPRALLAPALALALLGGCEIQPMTAGSGGGGGTTSGASQFCAAGCEAQRACDPSVVVASCTSGCANAYGAQLAHTRSDWIGAASACMRAASCGAWLAGTVVTSCSSQATAGITASGAARTYCQRAVAKDAACAVGTGGTEASCLEVAKTYDDASLVAASNCFAGDCSAYAACVRSATGG